MANFDLATTQRKLNQFTVPQLKILSGDLKVSQPSHFKKGERVNDLVGKYQAWFQNYQKGEISESEWKRRLAMLDGNRQSTSNPPSSSSTSSSTMMSAPTMAHQMPTRPLPTYNTNTSSSSHQSSNPLALSDHDIPPEFIKLYKENPFYVYQRTVLQLRIKHIKDNLQRSWVSYFTLGPNEKAPEYAIQILCLPLANTTEIYHMWPDSHFEILVNHAYATVPKAQKPPKQRDKLSDISNLVAPGNNVISIRPQPTTNIPLALIVNLFKVRKMDDLVNELMAKKVLNVDQCKKLGESDIQELYTRISLNDPLMLTRIVIPGRATTCAHISCFDLKNYLMFNQRTPNWKCPLCHKKALWEDMFFDSYLREILDKTPSSTTEILMNPDGSWVISNSNADKRLNLDSEEAGHVAKKPKIEDSSSNSTTTTTTTTSSTNLNGNNNMSTQQPQPPPQQSNFMQQPTNTTNNNPSFSFGSSSNSNLPTTASSFSSPYQNNNNQNNILQSPNANAPIQSFTPMQGMHKQRICHNCGKSGIETLRCSRCKLVQYCGRECQGKDWNNHKQWCYPPEDPQHALTQRTYYASQPNANALASPFQQQPQQPQPPTIIPNSTTSTTMDLNTPVNLRTSGSLLKTTSTTTTTNTNTNNNNVNGFSNRPNTTTTATIPAAGAPPQKKQPIIIELDD